MLSSSKQGQVLVQFALAPTCSVDTYYLEYQTVGARGEATTASAALMIPTGSATICHLEQIAPGEDPKHYAASPEAHQRPLSMSTPWRLRTVVDNSRAEGLRRTPPRGRLRLVLL